MNRRSFFRKAATGAAVLAAAPTILSEPFMPKNILDWANNWREADLIYVSPYGNIDPLIHRAATELSYRHGQSIAALYNQAAEAT